MSASPRRATLLAWTLFATLCGVSIAVWFVNLRPQHEFAPSPAMPTFELDRAALAGAPLSNPFLGNGEVRGIVRGADGNPIAHAAIHAWAARRTAEAESDANGFYALRELPPGPLRVIVGVEGYRSEIKSGLFLAADEVLALDFELAARAVPQPELLPAIGAGPAHALSGRCIDGSAGGTWYRVHIEPQRATDPLLRSSVETEALGTGFFAFDAVPAGRYRLRVTAASGPASDLLEFARIDDLEVPTGELTLRFAAPRLVLQLRNADAPEQALDRGRVAVFWSPSSAGTSRTREEWLVARQRATSGGTIALLPMPSGRLRLVVSAPGFRSAEREMDLLPSMTEELKLYLSPRT